MQRSNPHPAFMTASRRTSSSARRPPGSLVAVRARVTRPSVPAARAASNSPTDSRFEDRVLAAFEPDPVNQVRHLLGLRTGPEDHLSRELIASLRGKPPDRVARMVHYLAGNRP